MWLVGSEQTIVVEWENLSVDSVNVFIYYNENGTVLYLQNNLVSFASTVNSFVMTKTVNEWKFTFTVPKNSRHQRLTFKCVPTVDGVTATDLAATDQRDVGMDKTLFNHTQFAVDGTL